MYPAWSDLIILLDGRPAGVWLGILDLSGHRIVTAFGGTLREASAAVADYLGLALDELPPFTIRHSGGPTAILAEEIVRDHQANLRDAQNRIDQEYDVVQRRIVEKRGW